MRVSWKYLKENIINVSNEMSRSPKNEERYSRFKREKGDLNLYIINTYLKNKTFVILPNAFPYELRKGIAHYVMFSIDVTPNISNISDFLSEYFNKPKDHILWYINPPHLQSIPNVWHCHIFIKQDR